MDLPQNSVEPTVSLNISSLFSNISIGDKTEDVVVEADCSPEPENVAEETETISDVSGLTVEYVSPVNINKSTSSSPPRSILKCDREFSRYDHVVVECLSLLMTVPPKNDLLRSVQLVFRNFCVDRFFNGDCIDSLCNDVHYAPQGDILPLNENETSVWKVALFAICHSDQPDIQIVKAMISFFADRKDVSRTLAFAKCFSKIRSSQVSSLAQHLVQCLAGFINERDAVTTVLYLAAPQIDHSLMDSLMQSLGVFHRCLSYSELLLFLNSLAHKMGYSHLLKVLKEIMTFNADNEKLIKAVDGYLNRLEVADLGRIQLAAIPFFEKFRYRLTFTPNLGKSSTPSHKQRKKKIEFGKVFIAEFKSEPKDTTFPQPDIPATPITIDDDEDDLDITVNDHESKRMADKDVRFEKRIHSIMDVFSEWCFNQLLLGHCLETDCQQKHQIDEFSLTDVQLQKARLAAEFYTDRSTFPSLVIVKVFLDYFVENDDLPSLLAFAKCTPKLTPANAAELSSLVLSSLLQLKLVTRLLAIEMLLMPEIPLTNKPSSSQASFYIDKNVLKIILDEALNSHQSLTQMVTNEICLKITNLPLEDAESIKETIQKFFDKFVLVSSDSARYPFVDILPISSCTVHNFRLQFLKSLLAGSLNRYFVATMMLKFAVEFDLHDTAADVLYEFFMNNTCGAIVDEMLQHSRFINPNPVLSAVKLIISNVAASFCLRSYESGDLKESAVIFNMLRLNRINLLDLNPYLLSLPAPTKALACCNLCLSESLYSDAAEVFLDFVLDPFLNEVESSPTSKQINEMLGKLLNKLAEVNLVNELLKLYNETLRQLRAHSCTLLEPLNMLKFSETVLESCFCFHSDESVRLSCLKLYFNLGADGAKYNFPKVTRRSLLLTAVHQMDPTRSQRKQLIFNLLNLPLKELLVHCITSGAYPQFGSSCDQITLNSTMTLDEIRVYLFWWMFSYLKAKKNAGVEHYNDLAVKIIQDCVLDNTSRHLVHYSIKCVDNSISGCVMRLLAIMKKMIAFPMHPSLMLKKKNMSLYLIPWLGVKALSETVMQCLNIYDTDNENNDSYVCSSCFYKETNVVSLFSE